MPYCGDCAKAAKLVPKNGLRAIARNKTAGSLISAASKRSPSYHSELAEKTYEEILRLSERHDELGKRAKQMK